MTPTVTIDHDYLLDLLMRLLAVPSPSGRTDDVMHLIGKELASIGVPTELTRRGALIANLEGEQRSPDRAIVVHADTIGAMVREIKPNGRLRLAAVGTHPARSTEGARVTIFTDQGTTLTGTILPLRASGHAFGDAVDAQEHGWDQIEVRIDEHTSSKDETLALGIQVGDHVALDPAPTVTERGFIKARHLDGKAGVAAALTAVKSIVEADADLPVSAHLIVTIAEEVGLGASSAIHDDIAESVAIDNGVVAPGQNSTETGVSVCFQDSAGPLDFHLSRKLFTLAKDLGVECHRDVYTYYRSDTASALEAGAEMRAALLGYGVDASHGHERTHIDSLTGMATLLAAYLQTPLTFNWDSAEDRSLEDFPDQRAEPI